jgi:hypothetical protein
MSIPNHIDVVRRLAAEHPSEWSAAHRGGAATESFIRRLAATLHAMDPRFGLNGKRGNPNDISDDAINFDGESFLGDVDPTRGNAPVTVIDVIGGAPSGPSGPDGTPAWNPVTDPNVRPTLAAWVKPGAVSSGGGTGGGTGGGGGTQTPTACKFQQVFVDDMGILRFAVGEIQDEIGVARLDLVAALDEVRQTKAELLNLIARLEQGFVIDGNIKYLGAVKGTVRLPK